MAAPYSKSTQAGRKGKPAPAKGGRRLAAAKVVPEGEPPTVQGDAAARVVEHREARRVELQEIGATMPVDVTSIDHGRNARVVFSAVATADLVASVRKHGVLQPIRVKSTGDGRYQIVAGHRRYEAALAAHLTTIPAVVSTAGDPQSFIESLVENLQREDLDPIDEAKAYKALLAERPELTQEAFGKLIGRTQAQISNSLALLGLEESVQVQLSAGKINVGHAKVLARMSALDQVAIADQVVADKLSVRDVESKATERRELERRRVARLETVRLETEQVVSILKSKRVAKAMVVLVQDKDIAPELVALGWVNARPQNWNRDSFKPAWKCECKAVYVTMHGEVQLWQACIDKDHEKAHRKITEAAEREAAAANEKIVAKARRVAAKALRTDDALNIDGHRLALYAILMRYDQPMRKTFVEHHGGEWPKDYSEAALGDQVILAVIGLSAKDLAEEITTRIVATVLPNVFTAPAYGIRDHAAARAFLVEQFGLEPSLVWGGKEPPPKSRLEPHVVLVTADDGGVSVAEPPKMLPGQEPYAPEEVVQLHELVADAAAGDPGEQGEIDSLNGRVVVAVIEHHDALPPVTSEIDLFALAAEHVAPEPTPEAEKAAATVAGKVFVVTGVLETMERVEAQTAISQAGGVSAGAVTVKTDYLVTGDRPGAIKVNRAKELGIPTLNETAFKAMLRGE